MKLLYFIINICLATWVHQDAKKFRARGVSVIPGLWSTLVFFGSIPVFLLYILFRILRYKKMATESTISPLPPAARWTNWLTLLIMFGVIGTILLSVIFKAVTMTPSTTSIRQGQETSADEAEQRLQMKTRDDKRKSDVKTLNLATILYSDSNGRLPQSLSELEPKNISKIPTDPLDGKSYQERLAIISEKPIFYLKVFFENSASEIFMEQFPNAKSCGVLGDRYCYEFVLSE